MNAPVRIADVDTGGVAYTPKIIRAAEAIKANPQKSDRAIAEEIGVSQPTVSKARKETGDNNLSPDARTGRDGKSYPAKPIADIEDFWDCCTQHRWFYDLGILALQIAVDNLQWLAERWGLVDLHGQDEIQRVMALAFRDAGSPLTEEIPLAPELPKPAYRTPKATVDAFLYVACIGDVDELTAWLADHPRDADHLRKIWKRKCTAAL